MRILLLSQWFEPEPVFKGLEFARALAARGHDVQVVTGFPNYPGGKLYAGHRLRLWKRESLHGIDVLRVWLYPSHDRSAFKRVLNYLSFAVSAAMLAPFLLRRADVIYAYHPPPTVALPAFLIRAWWRVPVVYDVQDLWPDTVAETGMMRGSVLMSVLDSVCRWIYRRADHITVLSPGFRSALIARGVKATRIHVIYNWAAESAIRRRAPDHDQAVKLGLAERFVVMFAGTMGKAQGLESVLRAAAICSETAPKVLFAFVGGGVSREALVGQVTEMKLSNVRFIPFQPIEQMASILSLADLLLVHLKDAPLFRITIPSKTQAYLAAGKPVLMAVRGDAADLIERAHAGFTVPPEDPEALAAAVSRAASLPRSELDLMGEQGLEYYNRHLALQAGARSFEQVFELAITPRALGQDELVAR